jgi:hypothetical protein
VTSRTAIIALTLLPHFSSFLTKFCFGFPSSRSKKNTGGLLLKSMIKSAFADAPPPPPPPPPPPSAHAAEFVAFDSAAASLQRESNCHTSSSTTPNQPVNHASCPNNTHFACFFSSMSRFRCSTLMFQAPRLRVKRGFGCKVRGVDSTLPRGLCDDAARV